MSTPHKATDEQWEKVKRWAEAGHSSTDSVVCELSSRIEILEATQHLHADVSQLSEPVPEAAFTNQELSYLFSETGPTVLDGFRAIYDLGLQHGASKADPAVKDSLTAAPPPLRCPGAHTIAECGGPCEDDFRLCDCGLLQQLNPAPATEDSSAVAPAGGLVERVGKARANARVLGYDEDRAAIRAVAAWFTTITPRGSEAWRMASEVLREEADRCLTT
jgi:hypothetical protein